MNLQLLKPREYDLNFNKFVFTDLNSSFNNFFFFVSNLCLSYDILCNLFKQLPLCWIKSFICCRWLSHVSDMMFQHIDKSCNRKLVMKKPIVSMVMTMPRRHVLIFSILDPFQMGMECSQLLNNLNMN